MPSSIIVASSNANKLSDIRAKLKHFAMEVISLDQAKDRLFLNAPPEVEETEPTYLGNAKLKADAFFKWSRQPCLADDSGIEVEALSGRPGVLSARYAGESASPAERNAHLLHEINLTNLAAKTEVRLAVMRTVLCLKLGEGQYIITEGKLEGEIAVAPRGSAGWGYEPIFIPKGSTQTIAELKERFSDIPNHRGRALDRLIAILANSSP